MQPYQLMAHYHKWAYQILFKTMDQVKETDYFADKGLFCKSLHGLLNHLYCGDHIWFCRFNGKTHHYHSVYDTSFEDYHTTRDEILKLADRWIDFADHLPAKLPETISTKNFRNELRVTPYVPTLLHVFNHATHHRGQLSTALIQLGFAPPEMDLLYYLMANKTKT